MNRLESTLRALERLQGPALCLHDVVATPKVPPGFFERDLSFDKPQFTLADECRSLLAIQRAEEMLRDFRSDFASREIGAEISFEYWKFDPSDIGDDDDVDDVPAPITSHDCGQCDQLEADECSIHALDCDDFRTADDFLAPGPVFVDQIESMGKGLKKRRRRKREVRFGLPLQAPTCGGVQNSDEESFEVAFRRNFKEAWANERNIFCDVHQAGHFDGDESFEAAFQEAYMKELDLEKTITCQRCLRQGHWTYLCSEML